MLSDRYFEVEGVIFDNGVAIGSGDAVPGNEIDLIAGSLYLQTDGTVWRKVGTQWTVAAGAPVVTEAVINIDGGTATSVYGGVPPLDGGGA